MTSLGYGDLPNKRLPVAQISSQRRRRTAIERHDSLLTPFAQHSDETTAQVHVLEVQSDQLVQT